MFETLPMPQARWLLWVVLPGPVLASRKTKSLRN